MENVIDQLVELTKPAPRPRTIPFDPEKHKGYVPLLRNKEVLWVRPKDVPGMRSCGWKTVKEVNDLAAKRARKAAKNAPPVRTVGDVILGNE